MENGSVLSQAIEVSRGNVKEMMTEFKLSTMEQRNMIFEVFDKVSRLQVYKCGCLSVYMKPTRLLGVVFLILARCLSMRLFLNLFPQTYL